MISDPARCPDSGSGSRSKKIYLRLQLRLQENARAPTTLYPSMIVTFSAHPSLPPSPVIFLGEFRKATGRFHSQVARESLEIAHGN